jgi:hypothetical protein
MQINVVYDPSVGNAPAGFTSAITNAVSYLEKLFTNPVTITIDVGYGEVDGFPLDANALGESYYPFGEPQTYAAVVGSLKAENAPGASSLPSNSPFPASYTLYLSPAEAKALGLPLSVPDGGVDGYVGFSSVPNTFSYANGTAPPPNEYYFIGVVEHEITEIMGRVSLLADSTPDYSIIDLYRYLSPAVRDITAGGTNRTAYFSINNGLTNLGSWNNNPNNGDLADWYPAGPAPGGNDAFNDYSNAGVINVFSANDISLMGALGWTTTNAVATNAVISWENSLGGDFAGAANWSSGTVPGSTEIAAITLSGTYTVDSSEDETVYGLTTATGATLDVIGGIFTIANGTGSGANAGTMEAGPGGTLGLDGYFSNTGRIKALGGSVELNNATVFGGLLRSLGSDAIIETAVGSADTIKGDAILVGGSIIDIANGSSLTFRGSTIGPGALLDAMTGGTVVVSGTVTSSGTLLASGVDSTIDIVGLLTGGKAEIGNGMVEISNLSSEAVTFVSGGTGGLLLDNATGYTGKISGFGANSTQFIDLTNVTYDASVSCDYRPNPIYPTQQGVLTVTSGGQIVVTIHLLGNYTTADFTLNVDSLGHVQITDPSVITPPPASTASSLTVLDGTGTAAGTEVLNSTTFAELAPHIASHFDQRLSTNLGLSGHVAEAHVDVPLLGVAATSGGHAGPLFSLEHPL